MPVPLTFGLDFLVAAGAIVLAFACLFAVGAVFGAGLIFGIRTVSPAIPLAITEVGRVPVSVESLSVQMTGTTTVTQQAAPSACRGEPA
jgi:hypothetical protein